MGRERGSRLPDISGKLSLSRSHSIGWVLGPPPTRETLRGVVFSWDPRVIVHSILYYRRRDRSVMCIFV